MYSNIKSFGVSGIGGFEVSVEAYISGGLFQFEMVGLPDAAVKEARERVRASIKNNRLEFPAGHVTVNLAPADKKKSGTAYDLPIFIAIASAEGELKVRDDMAFIGELSLTGELRPVSGALPMALCAGRCGIIDLFVPAENAAEAAFAENIHVYGADNVSQIIRHLRGEEYLEAVPASRPEKYEQPVPDFSEVKGQENVKRAFEIAAAGGHNILIIGPPGAGKSMMAKRLPGILPDMTREEMIECTEIHSVSGLTGRAVPIVSSRPFRSPHHTVSAIGLSGGGTYPKPGEISLAHNGVLFLDELPEFHSDVLEVLRQPLEEGEITVSRVSGSATYPAGFMLVCAMNPCKCGWYGHPSGRCRCSEYEVKRYRSRISGPLLDRIDIIVEVPALDYDELKLKKPAESSADIRQRVNAAREIQNIRYKEDSISSNARMNGKQINKFCNLSEESELLMHQAYDRMGLTGRSYDRILRVARTIADLDGSENIEVNHLAEAIQYRTVEI